MLAGLAVIASIAPLLDASPSPAQLVPPADPSAVEVAALEAGLTPESFAVAGVTPAQAQSVLVVLGESEEVASALSTAHTEFELRSAALLQAEATLLANPGQPIAVAARDAAAAQVASAAELLSDVRQSARLESLGSLPQAVVAAIDVQARNAAWIVSAELRVLERTPEEWRAIEGALRSEARAARSGSPFGGPEAALLASARADPAVIQAQANLAAGLAQMVEAIGLPE